MDFVQAFSNIVPLGMVAAVFGTTYALGFFIKNSKLSNNLISGLPWLIGIILGTGQYLVQTSDSLMQKPWWVNVFNALLFGLTYGGAEVVVWNKIAKKTFFPTTPQAAPEVKPEDPKP